jgi:lipooligosaccharide transport system permease protein
MSTSDWPVLRACGYWLLRYRRTWRGTIVISVANPALFLTAMGAGLGKLVDQHNSAYLHGVSYLSFLAPGLLAAAMMQTAYIESAGPVLTSARAGGNYRAALATPLEPGEVYLGHLLFIAFRVLTSALAFAVVATLFGAVPATNIGPLVGAATLTGLAFAAPIAAWSVTVERPPVLNAGFRFVIMPLYMFSGTFFAAAQLPAWLRVIADCTPLYQGVELCRSVSLGTASAPAALGQVGYLLALVVVGLLLGPRTYRAVLTR